MSSPAVLINNLVQKEDTSYIDPISKIFLIGEVALGLNRLLLFRKIKLILILFAFAYTLCLCGAVVYGTFLSNEVSIYDVIIGIDSVQYLLSLVLNFIVWKRLQYYYQKLQEFDMTVGCMPKTSASAVRNIITMCILTVLMILPAPYEWFITDGQSVSLQQLPVRLLPMVEIHFYGHLLSLLVSRLRLINYYMKISLSDLQQVVAPKVDKFTAKGVKLESQNCRMKKLMDLYCIVISAYDMLIEAIKWQFIMVLTSTFISTLSYSYVVSFFVIRGTRPFVNVAAECAFAIIRLFPLFAPCMFGDQIREEVRRLRELLASRLYGDKLNKEGRSVARALLALTEARNLSFSLLQIFEIDISLPFKFMGLLLTYLIILLQFEKGLSFNGIVVPSVGIVSAVVMSSPTVLINNLIQKEDTSYIDPISQTFLIGEVALGLNRLLLFRKIKPIFILFAFAYTLCLSGAVVYITFFNNEHSIYNVFIGIDTVQYLLGLILNLIVWKRLQYYYQKLQEFDMTVGCRPKTSASAVRNLITMSIATLVTIVPVPYEWFITDGQSISLQQLPVRFLPIVEIHFYGHLLSLLVPRLRLINYYMKLSLYDYKQVLAPKVYNFTAKGVKLESQNCQMKKLMDLYCIVISAYDMLIEAIKWQFLLVLTSTFISILSFSYVISFMVIRGERPFEYVVAECIFTSFRLFPLFAPCIFGDQIREEVRRLRELLASRLYGDKLNKEGRSVARALLALTEARNLSFSLLQIFEIDISLPFKFMGLLLTYLIILLQFEKVINP